MCSFSGIPITPNPAMSPCEAEGIAAWVTISGSVSLPCRDFSEFLSSYLCALFAPKRLAVRKKEAAHVSS